MSLHAFGVTHMKFGAVLLVRSLLKVGANGTTRLHCAELLMIELNHTKGLWIFT